MSRPPRHLLRRPKTETEPSAEELLNQKLEELRRFNPQRMANGALKKQYVLGFLFNESGSDVLLIRKERPLWQKGFLNGVGGKIEQGESSYRAMMREFLEETGLAISSWERFATFSSPEWDVSCFRAFSGLLYSARSKTDEQVMVSSVLHLRALNTIENLKWLIPLALDCPRIAKTRATKETPMSAEVWYL